MSDAPPRNRLARETSPYLLQHAAQPVDWYPWGEEAFARAVAEDRPILLSIGYSTCHWCHVMARESFANAATAALMNDAFVCIKVDREERPDVDAVYMTFTQAMTGQGGWPMTVFLTPQGEPFFAGTYFPPDDQHGRPGFAALLRRIDEAWQADRERVRASGTQLTARVREALERHGKAAEAAPAVDDALPAAAVETLRGAFDHEWGGFGRAPKFPAASTLEFLLMHHARTGEGTRPPDALDMAVRTLERMAAGGIYDHLGGGFARYSTDAHWLVPHFEKMLYDNAQLARVYLHAWQITGRDDFERVVRETLGYLEREMLDPATGGFASAQDADTDGIEGKSFVWTPDEIDDVLSDDGTLFRTAYGVTAAGNFADPHHPEFGRRSVLHRALPATALAREFALDPAEVERRLADARARLLAARERRPRPATDDKVLVSWNGLAVRAFAEAGRVLGEPRLVEIAAANARFVRDTLWRDGRLLHTFRAGRAHVDGLLEDYAYYGLGLVELHRATGDADWLRWAADLLEAALDRFHDPEHGGWFEAPGDRDERLIVRQKPLFDAAVPSGNGAMALLAHWIGRAFDRRDLEDLALEVVRLAGDQLTATPSGVGTVLQAVELLRAPRRELAIVGPPAERGPFERVAAARYLPALLLVPADGPGDGPGDLPLLAGRGGTAAYLCEDMVCGLPATTPEALVEQLDGS